MKFEKLNLFLYLITIFKITNTRMLKNLSKNVFKTLNTQKILISMFGKQVRDLNVALAGLGRAG